MITVEKAEKIIMSRLLTTGTESVTLENATGRILAQDIVADRDFPPYDRVSMDGIAIDYTGYAKGRRTFSIAATGAAGDPQIVMSDKTSCVEIMTGAILPVGTDTVIRYEDLEMENGNATIQIETVKQGQNVHPKGKDRKANDHIVLSGKVITAAEIGVAATVGLHQIKVVSQPKVCVISTGDEVIPVAEKPLPHQIRSSNTHVIASILKGEHIECDIAHLPDIESVITRRLKELAESYDVLVLSGGVSKGKFDYIPDCLTRLGVEKHFHKIEQRPGKPFWFGSRENSVFVFALPGNPVSSTMCTVRYLVPWLKRSLGLEIPMPHVRLGENVAFRPDLTLFQQCKLKREPGEITIAVPVRGHGSGDLASLTESEGFIELPKGKEVYSRGGLYRWWKW